MARSFTEGAHSEDPEPGPWKRLESTHFTINSEPSTRRWRTDGRRAAAIDTLHARHAILDVIGCLFTNRCQIEKFLFYGYVFCRFGKLPILGRFVPSIISPI